MNNVKNLPGFAFICSRWKAVLEATLNVEVATTFGNVEKGKPLSYFCSSGNLAFAVNLGNFSKTYHLKPGEKVVVRRF